METKKSSKADLEKKRQLFFETGIVLSLALALVAFEWSTQISDNPMLIGENVDGAIEQLIPITRPKVKPPPPPPPQKIIEVINIVEEGVEIEEIDFGSIDVDEGTEYTFVPYYAEEPSEIVDFFVVEDKPMFQGGPADNFRSYIAKNLNYPPRAAENGIRGRVFIQFTINTRGEVDNVTVVGGVHPSLDNEAVRVIESSPKWTPGKQRGRAVAVRFTFPIDFVLASSL